MMWLGSLEPGGHVFGLDGISMDVKPQAIHKAMQRTQCKRWYKDLAADALEDIGYHEEWDI